MYRSPFTRALSAYLAFLVAGTPCVGWAARSDLVRAAASEEITAVTTDVAAAATDLDVPSVS
ncbi:MAG: hypothetical protein HY698_19520, partial [Deltaproteobacteria bacterium]|nr:hypothetical protein [Deltaproteobacteria bacterium]